MVCNISLQYDLSNLDSQVETYILIAPAWPLVSQTQRSYFVDLVTCEAVQGMLTIQSLNSLGETVKSTHH